MTIEKGILCDEGFVLGLPQSFEMDGGLDEQCNALLGFDDDEIECPDCRTDCRLPRSKLLRMALMLFASLFLFALLEGESELRSAGKPLEARLGAGVKAGFHMAAVEERVIASRLQVRTLLALV